MENISTYNWLAVLAAAVSTFIIGGVWYGAIFAKPWADANGFSDDDLKKANQAMIFGGSFVLALIQAVFLAMFIGKASDIGFGAFAGFATGAGWVATAFGVNYLFERRSFKLFLINGLYNVVAFTLMGIILGAWL